jgi:hypothetical protein
MKNFLKNKILVGLVAISFLIFVTVGVLSNVNQSFAAWDSNSATAETVNVSNRVKASTQFAAIKFTVANVGVGSDVLTHVALTLTGAGSFDPATDLAALTTGSENSGVGIYEDDGDNSFDAGDQAFSLSPGPAYSGTGPWTLTLRPVGANIPADTTVVYWVTLRTDSSVTDNAQVRLGLNSVTYSTAGQKTDLAMSAPAADSYYTIDTSAPTVSSRITQDLDADGSIDAIKVTMNENILNSTLTAGNFAVAGYTVASINGDTSQAGDDANDEIFYLILTETGTCTTSDVSGCDTDATPNVTYTAGTLTDHAGTALASTGAVAATDSAAPIAKFAKYKDIDNNGRVDRVDISFSEAIVDDTYDDADYTVATAGTITLADETAVTPSGDDLQVSALGAAGYTGGATNPEITYTNNFVDGSRGLNDAAGNAVATFTIAASDLAAPVINSVTIEDTDVDGVIDKLTYTWSENVDTNDGAAPVFGDLPTTLLPDGSTADFSGATISDPAGSANTVVVTVVTGQVTANTAVGATAISGDLSTKWVDTNANAAHVTGATANETAVDLAAPVKVSSTGSDSDNDGKTNTYVITFSENLVDADASGASVHPNFTTTNTNQTTSITLTDADIASGATSPVVTLNLDDTDTDNYTGQITFAYNTAETGTTIRDAAGNLTASFSYAMTDDVKPVLISARAINGGGTADVLDNAADYVEFVFSETMIVPIMINLEKALLFANGATDVDNTDSQNLYTTGAPDNTVSLVTKTVGGVTIASNNTIKVVQDQDPSINLLTPDTDTVRVTEALANLTDAATAPNVANENPVAVTLTLADVSAPTFSARATADLDADGLIDGIKITMNENISDATLTAGNFAVAGYTVASINGDTTVAGDDANDEIFYLILTEGAGTCSSSSATGCDTDAIPEVTYTAGTLADTSGNLAVTAVATAATDGAAPIPMYAKYKDITSVDGAVDRVDITFSEAIVSDGYDDADYTVATIGDITLADESAILASSDDLQLTVTADANETGGATNPAITYTSSFAEGTRGLNDAAGNAVATFASMAVTDAAAPYYRSSQTLDNDNNGTVDYVKIIYTESVLDSTIAATDFEAGVADTTTGNLTESFSSGTPGAGNATDTPNDSNVYVGVVAGVEPLTAKTTDYVLKIEQIGAITDALGNSYAAFTSQNSTDGAKPVIKNVTIEDTDSNGLVDKITFTWSENVDTDDSGVPVAGDMPTTLLPDGQTANFGAASFSDPGGASADVVVTGITGQVTVNTATAATAISGDISAMWVDGTANTSHADGATANEAIVDSAKPVLKTSTTADTNANGTVDQITIVYSETVAITDGSDADAFPGLAFANSCVAANADYASAGTTSSVVTVTGCTAGDTSITATPTHDADTGTIADLATGANEMADNETVTGIDGAGPAFLTATVSDADSDGDLDTLISTFSENLTNTAAGANGFDVSSAANHGTCNTESADPAVSSSLTLTFVCSAKSTAVGDLNVAFTANAGLVDSASNQAPSKTLTAASSPVITDGAAPIPLSATISKAVSSGNLQNGSVISVTFSETVTPTGAANSDWKFSRNAAEALAAANWPDGSTVAYSSSASTAVTMTLSAMTTSGAWGPYSAKVNMANNNTAAIVDGTGNQADIAATDVTISGISGPVVDAIAVTAITNSSATVDWITLSNTTVNRVKYGTTSAVGSTSVAGTPGEGSTSHSINLSGLTAGTMYYYQVCSTDSSETCSTIYNFTTTNTDSAAPAGLAITTADATVNADYYTIAGTITADAGDVTVQVLNGSNVVGTVVITAGQTAWSAIIALPQSAATTFTARATDSAGNAALSTSNGTAGLQSAVITEDAAAGQGDGTLAVTGISTTRSYATANDTWASGWAWTFNITVPTTETSFAMKFDNWTSGANTIAAADNIRFYTAQSTAHDTTGESVIIDAAGTDSTAIELDGDADANTEGRQIVVTVEAKVPTGSAGGSYSTQYGVTSEVPVH